MCGVNTGEWALVAAGVVVTCNVPPKSLRWVAGHASYGRHRASLHGCVTERVGTVGDALATDSLPWETIGTQTRYGRYASEVEERGIRTALELADPPAAALDIGCEGGRWSRQLADRGWQLICTDVTESSLSVCKARIPEAECILTGTDDTTLPVATGSLKLVLCIEVAPVIHAPWFGLEIERVLHTGGWLVGVCWNRRSWRGALFHNLPVLRARASNRWIGYPLVYQNWRRALEHRGFTVVHEEGYAWLPFRRRSDSPLVPVAAALERALGLRRLPKISPMIAFVARKG